MHPLTFVAFLAIAAMAMVYAMVQVSRAYLQSRDPGGWLTAYVLTCAAIAILFIVFLGDDLRANLPFMIGFPLGWLALHALILRFAIALRDAPVNPTPRIAEETADEFEGEPPPSFVTGILTLFKWLASMAVAVLIIAVGENLDAIHDLDAALAPYRDRLAILFGVGVGVAVGFALFMAGIIRLLVKAKESQVIIHGAVLAIVSACALGVVVLPPGVKLLVILTIFYALARILISTMLRIRR